MEASFVYGGTVRECDIVDVARMTEKQRDAWMIAVTVRILSIVGERQQLCCDR